MFGCSPYARILGLLWFLLLVQASWSSGADQNVAQAPPSSERTASMEGGKGAKHPDEGIGLYLAAQNPVVTDHSMVVAGRTIGYKATTGYLPLRDEAGKTEAYVFFTAYTKQNDAISFAPGNDLPFLLYLPVYTNSAWYHKKLPPVLQADPEKARKDSEEFAMSEYLLALAKGNELSGNEREKIAEKLASYTGLSVRYVRNSNLRIGRDGFIEELLRDEQRVLGVLDSRITGPSSPTRFMDDASVFNAAGPIVAAWNDYVRKELKYENDLNYEFLSYKVGRAWKWGSAEEGYVNVASSLGRAMSKSPLLHVFVASGLYDLDTSYFGTRYVISHLGPDRNVQDRITMAWYEAGHQMYTDPASRKKLKDDVAVFFRRSLSAR
jgi:carboxypeptidase C (cathepsin A)